MLPPREDASLAEASGAAPMRTLGRGELPRLFDVLVRRGYRVVGPTVRDGAIVYDELVGVEDLPHGWTDEQSPGRYRLRRRDDDAYFGFAVGPHSWKRYVFAPREPLVKIRRKPGGFEADAITAAAPRLAFVGVRGCELAALRIQDRVFVGSGIRDRNYAARREQVLVIAVDCFEPASTCFCGAMGTGPAAMGDYDLRLTELDEVFLIAAGTDVGRDIVAELDSHGLIGPASDQAQVQRERRLTEAAAKVMRGPDPVTTPATLFGNLEHPRWQALGDRCLACGSCTQVCPTCFCFNIEDRSTIDGDTTVRERVWDSCFSKDHSSIHGGAVQPAIADRYRQWLTHKLASWVTQFGTSGCVGCGRCTTWCPVGIDLREEVEAIAQTAAVAVPMPEPILTRGFPDDALVPIEARVLANVHEYGDVYTLRLQLFVDRSAGGGHDPWCEPGQFNMLSIPGVGDVPISVAGHGNEELSHTIRDVGAVTHALVSARRGDAIGLRGPFGSAWPLREARGHRVTIIAGGLGLAPLRYALLAMLGAPNDYPSVRLLYGARSPAEILYDGELLELNRRYPQFKASVTVDRAVSGWTGHVGVVTRLMRSKDLPADGMYFVCGPEVMMRFVLAELRSAGVPSEHAWVAVERNMKCAVGLCGRCQYGPFFVCKDGAVFRHDQLSQFFDVAGF